MILCFKKAFSFDLGPVHFVGLSTEYYGYYGIYGKGPVLTQYAWLQKDLQVRAKSANSKMVPPQQANKNRDKLPWIVAYHHRPFYCSNQGSERCSGFENLIVSGSRSDSDELR